MAEALLKENQRYIGKDVAEKAIEKINGKEGGDANEKKTERRTRRIAKPE